MRKQCLIYRSTTFSLRKRHAQAYPMHHSPTPPHPAVHSRGLLCVLFCGCYVGTTWCRFALEFTRCSADGNDGRTTSCTCGNKGSTREHPGTRALNTRRPTYKGFRPEHLLHNKQEAVTSSSWLGQNVQPPPVPGTSGLLRFGTSAALRRARLPTSASAARHGVVRRRIARPSSSAWSATGTCSK